MVGTFVALSLAGLRLTRPWVRKRGSESNELANYYFAAAGVFYALLVGLIAVATWENHSRIEDVVTGEAVAVTTVSLFVNPSMTIEPFPLFCQKLRLPAPGHSSRRQNQPCIIPVPRSTL
jgi:hypothetical protein